MRINHNIAALNTHRQLNIASGAQSKSMEKLSSGLRINRAGDDAAGLAISEKMRGQIRGLDQASRNAQDGISLIQTAEGALNESHDILQRMRELAVQSSNDTNVTVDRDSLQQEMDQLAGELDRVAKNTEFNTQNLLDGSFTNKEIHIGANENQKLTIGVRDMSATGTVLNIATDAGTAASVEEVAVVAETNAGAVGGTGDVTLNNITKNYDIKVEIATVNGTTSEPTANITVNGVTKTVTGDTSSLQSDFTLDASVFGDIFGAGESIVISAGTADYAVNDEFNVKVKGAAPDIEGPDISTYTNAQTAIQNIDNAIKEVSQERSQMGAWQNRLEHTINNLGTSSENLTAAESRIRDVDMAKEMMDQTKNSILSQAAQAMLAQANQQPQGVLQLLR